MIMFPSIRVFVFTKRIRARTTGDKPISPYAQACKETAQHFRGASFADYHCNDGILTTRMTSDISSLSRGGCFPSLQVFPSFQADEISTTDRWQRWTVLFSRCLDCKITCKPHPYHWSTFCPSQAGWVVSDTTAACYEQIQISPRRR